MKRIVRIVIGLTGSLLLILVALAFFVRHQIIKSFPVVDGTVTIAGLHNPVSIVRDLHGVPTIDARDEHDLFLATGYVHAQDRLWQMDMMRRLGMGRLSELFGMATVPYDRMFRIIGLHRTAAEVERTLAPAVRERLQWYADGVNASIAASKGRLPLEFDLLRYDPEPWTPFHSIVVGRVMAWELNLSWWTDLTYGQIAGKVGKEKLEAVMPSYPASVAPQVPAEVWRTYAGALRGYLSTAQEFAARSGAASMQGGSNAWVVAPSKSARHAVLLANDTHLRLQAPSPWYELTLRAPGYHVGGMTVPGLPAVVAGRNDSVAWGITNIMADDADFYLEKVDSSDTNRTLYNGQWVPMTLLQEEISVHGEREPVPCTVRLTRHGPVVTDIVTPLQQSRPNVVASMRWTGSDPDDQVGAFDAMNRARNAREFAAALRRYPGPGQNFVFGDAAGNIGFVAACKIPIRQPGQGLLPVPGWDPATEWKGYVPFDQLPHLLNPPEGFIASANNRLTDASYPYYISDLWEPPSRILRLRELLGQPGATFTAADFERMQMDQQSLHAREVLPFLLAAVHDSALGVAEEDRVIDYLRNWNAVFAPEDIATAVYQEFFVRLVRNTYADEMGEELFHDWVRLVNIPIRVTTRLLQTNDTLWFDDVRTPVVETRDMIIRKSLREAIHALEEHCGPDPRTWRWGTLHTVTIQHPFGLQPPLGRIFNLGPFPTGGGSTTLMSMEYDLNEPFAATVGPSFRQVFDLADGERRSILPTGQSGQVYHPQYDDQTPLWLRGATRVTSWSAPPEQRHLLTLEPQR